jgi:hypothetical protein
MAPSESEDSFLEDLVHQKAQMFRTKLEVLTAEVLVRLNIMSRNLRDLDDQRETVREMLGRIDQQAVYHLREHREKSEFYRQLFAIGVEKRQQEVECWRDVAMVMKDFLEIWEAHQQAQARAIFLKDAGS